LKDKGAHIVGAEVPFAADLYGGRIDFIVEVGGPDGNMYGVVDVKTGTNVYKSHTIQVVAYAEGIHSIPELAHMPVSFAIVLHLKSTTNKGYQEHITHCSNLDWTNTIQYDVLVGLLRIHRYEYGTEPIMREDKEVPTKVCLS
jgi:predicted RecB family nuclease